MFPTTITMTMTSQGTPFVRLHPEIRPHQGLIIHWYPLMRPAIKLLSNWGGVPARRVGRLTSHYVRYIIPMGYRALQLIPWKLILKNTIKQLTASTASPIGWFFRIDDVFANVFQDGLLTQSGNKLAVRLDDGQRGGRVCKKPHVFEADLIVDGKMNCPEVLQQSPVPSLHVESGQRSCMDTVIL